MCSCAKSMSRDLVKSIDAKFRHPSDPTTPLPPRNKTGTPSVHVTAKTPAPCFANMESHGDCDVIKHSSAPRDEITGRSLLRAYATTHLKPPRQMCSRMYFPPLPQFITQVKKPSPINREEKRWLQLPGFTNISLLERIATCLLTYTNHHLSALSGMLRKRCQAAMKSGNV